MAKFVIEMPASERPIQLEIDDREAGGASHEERFEPSNAQSLERELRLPTWHPNGSIHQVWVRIIEVTADIFTEGGAFERYEGESLDGGCFVFQPPPNPPPATTRVEY